MPDHSLKPIAAPTLINLKEVGIGDFPTVFHFLEYGYKVGLDGGGLYDVSGKNRQIKISDHFTADEFAVSGTQSFDFARIHEDLVYELEKIRFFLTKV